MYLLLKYRSKFCLIMSINYINRLLLLFLHRWKLTIYYIDPSRVCSPEFFLFALLSLASSFSPIRLEYHSVLNNSGGVWVIIDDNLCRYLYVWLWRIKCFWFWLHWTLPVIHLGINLRLLLCTELYIMFCRCEVRCHQFLSMFIRGLNVFAIDVAFVA